jgi:hypothetical protein
VANVLADGRVAGSSTGGGVIVHELTGDDVVAGREVRRYDDSDHVDIVVPWDQVATWRVTCQCGWTGSERPAVTEPEYGTRECPESLEDSWAAPEWDTHVAPFAALTTSSSSSTSSATSRPTSPTRSASPAPAAHPGPKSAAPLA